MRPDATTWKLSQKNQGNVHFFFVYFRETSAPLTAKIIDTTNADLELKVEVNQTSMALIPRREQLEANSPVTKPCIGEKEWV